MKPLPTHLDAARRRFGGGLLQLSLAGLLMPRPLPGRAAAPAPLSDSEMRAVRTVVEAQLAALAANDAERAFSFASPAIRSQFGDAATFMSMVQTGYPMVVRPVATSFYQPSLVDGVVWQPVQLRDRDGRLWLATYQLQRQAGGGLRINGCAVVADNGKSST